MQPAMSQGNSSDRATWIDASRSPNRSAPGRRKGARLLRPVHRRGQQVRRDPEAVDDDTARPRPRPTSTISFEISAYGGDPPEPAGLDPAMRRTAASRDSNIFS